jgi:ribosomal protein L37AE/L43A
MDQFSEIDTDPDNIKMCPYCNTPIRIKRMTLHIIKCKKQFRKPSTKIFQCRYGAGHYIPAHLVKQHEQNCPFKPREPSTPKIHGDCTLPVYKERAATAKEEDWTEQCNAPPFAPADYEYLIRE